MERKSSFSIGGYLASLIGLGVPPEDAVRCANKLRSYDFGSPDSPMEQVDLLEVAGKRVRDLISIGENEERVRQLLEFLERRGFLGVCVLEVAASVAGDLNMFVCGSKTYLTIADLVHPNHPNKPISFKGAYVLSEMVRSPSCLGSAMNAAVRRLEMRAPVVVALNELTAPVLDISDIIIENGGWRFLTNRVLPHIRQKTEGYFTE